MKAHRAFVALPLIIVRYVKGVDGQELDVPEYFIGANRMQDVEGTQMGKCEDGRSLRESGGFRSRRCVSYNAFDQVWHKSENL